MSKGSRQRPCAVSMLIADLRFDLAFGKTEEVKEAARKKLIELAVLQQEQAKPDEQTS